MLKIFLIIIAIVFTAMYFEAKAFNPSKDDQVVLEKIIIDIKRNKDDLKKEDVKSHKVVFVDLTKKQKSK